KLMLKRVNIPCLRTLNLIMWLFTLSILTLDIHDVQATSMMSRGYTTTPQELVEIKRKADLGLEPYASAVAVVLEEADEDWDFRINDYEECEDADSPNWLDNGGGMPILYAKALSYHLTGEEDYAEDVIDILEEIM